MALFLLSGRARGDQKVPTSQDYQSLYRIKNLLTPLTAGEPATLGILNPTGSPCNLASPGSLGVPVCASGGPASLTAAAIGFGSSGGLLTGDAVNLTWNSTSHLATIANILSPGTLQISSLTGPGLAKLDSAGHFSVGLDGTDYLSPSTGLLLGGHGVLSLVGRPVNSIGNVSDVSATAGSGCVYRENGSTIGCGTIGPAATTGIVANWDPNVFRVYAIDYDAGSDAAAGFATAASSSLSDFQAADVAAGAVAIKTMQQLGNIIPRQGAGRKVAIIIANRAAGASYLKQDGVTVDSLDSFMSGTTGYAAIVIWATGTNSTCGATKFTGTTNDLICAGGIPVPGTNAAGYHPTAGATTTTVPATMVGGGAPGLAAEPLAPLGYSTRFDVATSTTALQNQARGTQIVSTTSTTNDTVSPQAAWPVTPSTSDTFYLEQPGVVCAGWGASWDASLKSTIIVGVRSTTLVNYAPGSIEMLSVKHMFDGFGGSTALGTSSTGIAGLSAVDPGFGTGFITRGSSIHIAGNITIQPHTFVEFNSVVVEGTSLFEQDLGGVNDDGAVFGGSVTVQGGAGISAVNTPMLGSVLPALQGRVLFHGVKALGGALNLKDVQITGSNPFPAISMVGQGTLFLQGPSGSTGNTDVGLDLTGAQNTDVVILTGTIPTVTGTLGDVRLADGTIITWAQATAGVIDSANNRISGSGPFPIRVLPTGTTLSGGPLTVPNLVGPGFVKASNSAGLFAVDSSTYLLDPTCNGIVVRTASGVTTCRTITSTGGSVTITNPTGVAGNINLETTGAPPTGAAGGALTGAYPNPGVNLSAASVSGALAESQVTNLVTDLGNLVPKTRTISVTAPGTIDGGSSADLSANRTIAFPVFAGSAAGLVPPSGGGTTNFLRADGTYAVPAGTGGAGTVTSVTGTSGQILCTPSSPNPVCSLVAKGAGAGSYGGSGIAGFTLDGFGAVTAVTSATYLTSAGMTPGVYNSVSVAASGLINGGAATSWVASGILKSAGLSAVPVAATAGTDYEVPLTFINGLTRATNTITNDLITGKSGGQTVIGDTASGGNLHLQSTTNATRGHVYFGSGTAGGWDDVNGTIGVGGFGTTASGVLISANGTTAGGVDIVASNNAGVSTTAYAAVGASLDGPTLNTNFFIVQQKGLAFSGTTGFNTASSGLLWLNDSANAPLNILNAGNGSTGGDIVFTTKTATNQVARFAANGTLTLGSATGIAKLTAGVLGTASSSDLATAIGMPTAGQVDISAGTGSAPVGDVNFTYNTSTHTLFSGGPTFLGGTLQLSAITGPGILAVDGVGNVSATPSGYSKQYRCLYSTGWSPGATVGIDSACDGYSSTVVPFEWPNDFAVSTVKVRWNLQINAVTGTTICNITRNGSPISGDSITITSGTLTGVTTTTATPGGASAQDTYGETCGPSGGGTSGTILLTTEIILIP